MKEVVLCLTLILVFPTRGSGQDLNDLFVAGLNDAERFANAYLAPVSEGAIYSVSNGWYNTADAKPLLGFEISIVGNVTGFKSKSDKKSFLLDPAEYENLDFVNDPGDARQVSTALGDIEGVRVFVESLGVREEFDLPSGLASENFDFIPTGFIQASVGLVKGLEVKARFLPTIRVDEAEIGLYGAGLQYEFTKLLPADKLLPIAMSAVVGYTNLSGEYEFTDSSLINGADQRLEADFRTWNFSAVVSTRKIPVINFYAGVGYVTGKSDIDLLGTYTVSSGPLETTYTDPFTVATDASGIVANIGTKLKLGFFRLHADYSLAEFSTFSGGISFGFR